MGVGLLDPGLDADQAVPGPARHGYIMVGVLVIGFIANLLIRPVNERFHEPTHRQARFERAATAPTAATPTSATERS